VRWGKGREAGASGAGVVRVGWSMRRWRYGLGLLVGLVWGGACGAAAVFSGVGCGVCGVLCVVAALRGDDGVRAGRDPVHQGLDMVGEFFTQRGE